MKILWLTEFFPQSDQGEITGGVEARCFYVSRSLLHFGHNVNILADRTSGSRWSHFSLKTLFTGIPYYLRMIARSVSALWTDFDIIEGTNYTTYPFAWLLGSIRRKPIIFWYPDVFVGEWVNNIGPAGYVGELVENIILKLPVNKYIAISRSTKDKLIKSGVDERKIELIYCGVDFAKTEKVSSKNYRKEYDIVSVARLVGYKRVLDIVKTVGLLRVRLPNISLAIVGQGPEKKLVEQEVHKFKMENNVKFLGFLRSHEDTLAVIAKSKILCLASVAEGFGIVTIESAALGVPTVLSNIPVLREVTMDGMGGLFFKPKDIKDLSSKIERLLTDKKLYEEKRQSSKMLAQKYDWQKIARQTEKIYREVLNV